MNQVTISNDVSTLGPEATIEDLERYRVNLERLLNEEFGDTCVDARVMHSTRVVGSDEVAERVEEIERSDEWVSLAFG